MGEIVERIIIAVAICGAVPTAACAADFDYALEAKEIAEDTYVFEGNIEHFTFANGGNIQNTAFVVTSKGVVVWDTGPSRAYGEQMLAAIRTITDQPVVKVLISHQHPDHFLGSQAFADAPLEALPMTVKGIREQGDALAEAMYRMAGQAMFGTQLRIPSALNVAGEHRIGDHEFALYSFDGHTDGDLVLFDRTSGVLFAGDLVFAERAPTTPHADVERWLGTLDQLAEIPATQIVPGHGPVEKGREAITRTKDYLAWLHAALSEAAIAGVDMADLMYVEIPKQFQELQVVEEELQRSVSHLFPRMEEAALDPIQ